jgi:RNA polymerase sigma-70 factor (ECF subfamily)
LALNLGGLSSTDRISARANFLSLAGRVHDSNKLPDSSTQAGTDAGDVESCSDENLMQAYVAGDAAAFDQLLVRYKTGLFNFILRSLGQRARAEEVLQEVFIRVIRARERYQSTARFSTWIYTIARNLCVDESRRRRFRDVVSLDAPAKGNHEGSQPLVDGVAGHGPSVEEQADAPTLASRMSAAVATLPQEQREVFLLRQISELSFKEIADIVSVSENTIKSRMRYALEKIREELADLDPRPQVDGERTSKRSNATGEAAGHG